MSSIPFTWADFIDRKRNLKRIDTQIEEAKRGDLRI
jgi:hypothetical protein